MEKTTAPVATAEKPWLDRYDYWVPAHLNYPHCPVDRLLDLATMQYPDNIATIFLGQKILYRDLNKQVNALAAALQELGIKKGDRVALMLPNSPQFIIAYYATLRIGAIEVNVNPLYTPREIGLVLNETQSCAVFMLDQGVPMMQHAREAGQFPALKHLIAVSLGDYMADAARDRYMAGQQQQHLPTAADLPTAEGIHPWSKLMAQGESKQPARPTIDPKEDVAVLQFTGGTTGTPKGAMLTHYNIVVNALQSFYWAKEYVRAGKEIYLTIIPFFHVYGMSTALNGCTLHGCTQLLVPRFDAGEVLQLIQAYKPGYFPGVPTIYIGLLNHPAIKDTDLSSLRIMVSGSAPLPREVQTRFQAYCSGVLAEGYGLSEASPSTHCNPIVNEQRAGSIGLPFPDTDAKIVDGSDDHELPPGEIGELIISGPQVMKGYYNRPEETAQTLRQRADGKTWLYTGDIARMDADGFFYIVDRKKDMILVSGFKVYPREVEEVLFTHPAVREATAIGIPDAHRGETVKAFVVLQPGAQATEAELIAYCRERLAGYKTPSQVAFTDSLPKSTVGKVLRTELRRQEATKPSAPVTSS